MKNFYVFEYFNESEYKKLEKAVKKYNMGAYKKLIFEFYPAIKDGKLLGKLISTNSKDNTESYELKLPTDNMFSKVHGDIVLHYTVYKDKKIILLNTISPEDILSEGHRSELSTYKGVMVSKSHAEKDMFKINLLKKLEG